MQQLYVFPKFKLKVWLCSLSLLFLVLFYTGVKASIADSAEKIKPFMKYFGPPPPPKVDIITTLKEKYVNANFFFWSGALKAGFGTVFTGGATDVFHYGGVWLRPLSFTNYKGDLILGVNYSMPTSAAAFWDVQAEHRHSFGLGYGGGVYQLGSTKKSINYWGKVSFRKTIQDWSFFKIGHSY
jgi:hypothetical protein